MTIVVLWYREKTGELWCAADTRLSGGAGTLTDHGPKILPVPVVCHEQVKGGRWRTLRRHSFGFAFSGSSLSAISTHALATACTQNLAEKKGPKQPMSVESVANLFCSIGQHCIADRASRLGVSDQYSSCFFDAIIFGFCPRQNRFKAYAIVSSLASGTFQMNIGELLLSPHGYHPMGSGAEAFVKLNDELKGHEEAGVMTTLKQMVRREIQPDVGGHLQIGICGRTGFRAVPVLNTEDGQGQAFASFLGWNATNFKEFDGFTIGYEAIRP